MRGRASVVAEKNNIIPSAAGKRSRRRVARATGYTHLELIAFIMAAMMSLYTTVRGLGDTVVVLCVYKSETMRGSATDGVYPFLFHLFGEKENEASSAEQKRKKARIRARAGRLFWRSASVAFYDVMRAKRGRKKS